VALGIHKDSEKLTFIVHDDGMGIPEDEHDKIFEPFLRGKDVTSIQGTGLGLSIVKKAVELLNGVIKLESRPGEGTTFIVTIPEISAS
jgi:signal transduction histidine kinase